MTVAANIVPPRVATQSRFIHQIRQSVALRRPNMKSLVQSNNFVDQNWAAAPGDPVRNRLDGGSYGEDMRLEFGSEIRKFPECSITSPRPPRMSRINAEKRNFDTQASMAVVEGIDRFLNMTERERGESMLSH